MFKRLEGKTVEFLVENKALYHRDCYKKVVHSTNLNRLKIRTDSQSSSKRSEPSEKFESSCDEDDGVQMPPRKILRSDCNGNFDKDNCVICQKYGGNLHTVNRRDIV